MKLYVLWLFVLIASTSSAQTPQFAVVRPDGTTYICPSFDSAHNKAVDDDYIYLPGTVITGDKTITKRLTIIGAGHYPDSTQYTGKTHFAGSFFLEKKCTLEGMQIDNQVVITSPAASNCSFIRLKTSLIILGGTNDHFIDGSVFSTITGGYYNNSTCTQSSNIFVRNSLLYSIEKLQYSNFSNCIFLGNNSNYTFFKIANSQFDNCIFRGLFTADWYFQTPCYPIVGNSSNHCLWQSGAGFPGLNNLATSQPDTVMVNSGNNGTFFDYQYNYHLRPNSPYLTAGSGGTEIGIYGGNAPYKEGAVPGNPHIYFKQVSTQTNVNGQLPVQFKVRTNN
ncbi:MAG: hypothetical protein JNM88_19170 [Chitinophagaceae bacterium]|nr:hypothetical protein [Chitinophagaceae bacterium]